MAASGSGGYGGPNFSQVERDLRNVAVQFGSIVQLQTQLRASVDAWRTLEKELTLAQAAAEGTRAEFQKMETAARNFSMATTYSASQVANAMYSLASAGMNVNQTLAATNGVVLLAQATMTDLGEAADIVSSTLSQFNLQASDSYRVANLFVASTNASLATLPKLAFALRQVGPIAAQANMSLEQTVGTLDKLFDAGLRGEQAGTALRNAIARIIDPAGAGKMLLNNLGIDSVDRQTGQLRNMLDVFKDLSKQNLTLGDVSNIFGVEAAAGGITLLKQLKAGADGATTSLEQHIQAITNTNAAYRQSVLQMQTLDGNITRITNAFNDMRIELGQMLTPLIKSFTSTIVEAAQALRDMDTSTQLTYASWALAAIGFFTGVKALSMVVTGAVTATKAIATLGTAVAELRALSAATAGATMVQQIALGAPAAASLLGSLGAIAGVAVGLGGVALALGLIAKGIYEAREAAKEAALQETLQNVYEKYGQNKNLNSVDRSRMQEDTDFTAARREQYANIDAMSNVDPTTGTGSTTRFRMLGELYKAAQADAQTARQQLDALKKTYEQLNAEFGMDRAAVERSMVDSFSASPIQVTMMRHLTQQVVRGNMQQRDATELTGALVSSMRSLGGQTQESVRTAFRAYGDQLTQIANKMNLPEESRQGIKAIVDMTNSANSSTLLELGKQLSAGAEKSRDEILQAKPLARANIFNDVLAAAFEQVEKSASADPAMIEAQKQKLVGVINAAADDMKQISADQQRQFTDMAREAATNLTESMDVSPARMKQIMASLEKATDGGWLNIVADEIRRTGGDMQAAGRKLAEVMVSVRAATKAEIDKGIEQSLSIAIVDMAKINKLEIENRRRSLEAQKRLIEATTGRDTSDITRAIAEIDRGQTVKSATTELLDYLGSVSNDAKNGIERLRNWDQREGSIEALMRAGANSAGKSQDAYVEGIIKELQSVKTGRDTPSLRAAIRAYMNKAKSEREGIDAELTADLKSGERRQVQLDPAQEAVKKLLNLPTQEELYVEQAKLRMDTVKIASQYFNLPIDVAQQAVAEAEIGYREKIIAFQKKYRGFYTSSIADGVAGLIDNKEMQDAFSGRSLAEAMLSGQTQFNGKTYTREALQSQAGLNDFLAAIEAQFTKLVGTAPGATERIAAAHRVLENLGKEMGGTLDNFSAQMQSLTLKAREAELQAREFIEGFELQRLIDAFQLAINSGQLNGRMTEVTLDMAVKARVAQVKIDGQQAVTQLRSTFQEFFKNSNIPVSFNPSTNKFELVQSGGASDPMVMAADRHTQAATALSNAARDLSTAARGGSLSDNVSNQSYAIPRGRISSGVGMRVHPVTGRRSFHGGLDIPMPIGTSVAAPAAGTIIGAGRSGNAGNMVTIKHDDGLVTRLMHLSSIAVKIGDRVAQGQDIARSGNTGRSTGPHLHLQTERNGQVIDPRRVGTVRSAAIAGVVADEVVTPLQTQLREMTQAEVERANAEIARRNAELEALQRYWDSVAEFMSRPENAAPALLNALDQVGKAFDDTTGAVLDATSKLADIRAGLAGAQMQAAFRGGDPAAGMGFALEQQRAQYASRSAQDQLAIKRGFSQRIAEEEMAGNTANVISLQQQQNEALAQTIAYYEQLGQAATLSVENQRAAIEAQIESIRALAESDGMNTVSDLMDGLRSGILQIAKDVPTAFETAMQFAGQAVQGLGNIIGNVLTTGGQGTKKMIAGILASMASLIANMIAQYAIIQMISMLPGGRALLAAMDMGASIAPVVNAGAAVVNMNRVNSAVKMPSAYANGGVHSPQRMAQGGVGRDPSMAIFAEAGVPEAFIPMLDGKTIPVTMDGRGNAFVQVPSGERIPVSMKKFAQGGVHMPWSAKRAAMADRVSASSSEAVSKSRGGVGGDLYSSTVDVGGIHISISGNASADDADTIGNIVAEKLGLILDQRESEAFRKQARRSGTMQSQYYGGN